MPNWTSNQLIIEGDTAKVKEAAEFIKSADSVIDFDKIIPMPEILRNTGSGFRKIDGNELKAWFEDKSIEDYAEREKSIRAFTPAEAAELERLDCESWYDWSCQNWGTKWNACEASVEQEFDGYLEIHFDTAWSAPEPIVKALRDKFPELEVQLNCRFEDDSAFPHSV
jgi:Ferredoxin-like domain in Api92-like protein